MSTTIKLVFLSDAGGVGKTTIAVNLAYEWSLRGKSACIIDLDSNHSLDKFVDLERETNAYNTSVKLFAPDFDGSYPFKPIFERKNLFAIQGTRILTETEQQLVSRKRREYILAKALEKYSPQVDLMIFDCRAGSDLISENALAAATHVLIPIDVGVKALTASELIEQIYTQVTELELEPAPEILGLLPNHFNHKASFEKELLASLKEICQSLGIKLYPPLRQWQHLKNAAMNGQPLKQYRSADPLNIIFSEIVDDLQKIQHLL